MGPITVAAEPPSGTPLVQFGAFATPELAAAEWERYAGLFSAALDGRERLILQAESGGQTF